MPEVSGEVAPKFSSVREAFENNFVSHGDVGAAFALYHRGEKVVDIWGGLADKESRRPWEEDTLQYVFSTTKGITAMCAHVLAQRGDLDIDAPVADYWPEFKAEGKENIPVRWLLGHRAGLPALRTYVTPDVAYEWEAITSRLAAEPPVWEPGTTHGYHAITYGWLVGEVIRRVSGKLVRDFVADEFAPTLGLDLYVGVPSSEESRVSTLETIQLRGDPPAQDVLDSMPPEMRAAVDAFTNPMSLTQRALTVVDPAFDWNSHEMRAAGIPSIGCVTDARSVAKIYASCIGEVDGVRIFNEATLADAAKTVSDGPDKVLFAHTRFGSGFMLQSPFSPLSGPNAFGHSGAGGSLGFADPDLEIGFGYVMNQMQGNLSNDPRTVSLIDAIKASL